MRLSAIQMNPGADKAANLVQAEVLIAAAMADHPDFMALPEVWSCLGGSRESKRDAAETLPTPGDTGGPAYEFLRRMARAHRIHLHGGSIGERAPDAAEARIFNTTLVFDPNGTEIARYRKIHLFDMVTKDGQTIRESATYGAGNAVVTCRVNGLGVGLAICYDIRFAELFLALRRAGAELIVLPAAFTVQTGQDHWEVLIRARAIETQCWFLAAGTIGQHTEIGQSGPRPRFTYGHSLICDPWGHIVAQCDDTPGHASATLDPALTARVRRDMPVLDHRVLSA